MLIGFIGFFSLQQQLKQPAQSQHTAALVVGGEHQTTASIPLAAYSAASRHPLTMPFPPSNFSVMQQRRVNDDDEDCELHGGNRNAEELCTYLKTADECDDERQNPFILLRYCVLSSVYTIPVFYAFSLLFILIVFYLLGDTAQSYFVPSLTQISAYLHLSPNVAGVTFLALGNGAPDISSIVAGALKGSSGFAIGEPVGAGVFVTTVVMGLVTLLSNVKVTRRPYIRDVFAYLVSACFVFVTYLTGKIYTWESILCFLIYATYVTIVVVGRIVYQRIKKKRLIKALRAQIEAPDEIDHPETVKDWEGGWKGKSPLSGSLFNINSTSEEDDFSLDPQMKVHEDLISHDPAIEPAPVVLSDGAPEPTFIPKLGLLMPDGLVSKGLSQTETVQESSIIANYFDEESVPLKTGTTGQYNTMSEEDFDELNTRSRPPQLSAFLRAILLWLHVKFMGIIGWFKFRSEWDEKSILKRLFFIIVELPWVVIRDLTIPQADPEKWSKVITSLTPIFGSFFTIFAITGDPISFWNVITIPIFNFIPFGLILLPAMGAISLLLLLTSRRKRPPFYFPVIVAVCFVQSIVWLYLIANVTINLLQAVGISFGVSESLLAITLLSWGNSVSDMIADIVVARQGYPAMAIGAIYGSPLMNLLLGLSIAYTYTTVMSGKFCLSYGEGDPIVVFSFVFLILGLAASLFVVPLAKFRSPKPYGVVLILVYGVYMALIVFWLLAGHKISWLSWMVLPERSC